MALDGVKVDSCLDFRFIVNAECPLVNGGIVEANRLDITLEVAKVNGVESE